MTLFKNFRWFVFFALFATLSLCAFCVNIPAYSAVKSNGYTNFYFKTVLTNKTSEAVTVSIVAYGNFNDVSLSPQKVTLAPKQSMYFDTIFSAEDFSSHGGASKAVRFTSSATLIVDGCKVINGDTYFLKFNRNQSDYYKCTLSVDSNPNMDYVTHKVAMTATQECVKYTILPAEESFGQKRR